ncbi:MAG: hypothetical protein PHF86_01815 [Candidatus Nanoarchaeia archaeon]|nr:hypothetical protein [Candidatus Nanoarchaeia archaeon]
MYILNPNYGDMSVVVLGSSIKKILSKLKKHWEDELENPDEYEKDHIKKIHLILNKEFKDVNELMEMYNELIDEDYIFEETF